MVNSRGKSVVSILNMSESIKTDTIIYTRSLAYLVRSQRSLVFRLGTFLLISCF